MLTISNIGKDNVTIHIDSRKSSVGYAVIDGKSGEQVGKLYKSRARARNRADKLDSQYGGYRYSVVAR